MTAAAGITTSGQPPTAVVNIQPGMNVQPVVLVDQNGQYVTPGGSSTTANSLATTTVPVNVAAATAPSSGQVLTATSGTTATWQAAVASVGAADTSVVVGGTSRAPTIRTNTLDVIAADQPPAANWSNNSHKITSLANGSAAQDAAAFGQTLAGGSGGPLTTAGDLLYENATPAPARLAVGTARQALIVSNGLPAWGTPTPYFDPSDMGWLAWTQDPALVTASSGLTNNTIYLTRVNVRAPVSCTNVLAWIVTAGTGLTSGQNFGGLYDSTGAKVAATADQTTNWAATGPFLSVMPLSGGPYNLSAGFYWVALLSNESAGATPVFARQVTAGTSAQENAGLTVSTARWATNGTGTSLPSSITPSSNVLQTSMWWAGLS